MISFWYQSEGNSYTALVMKDSNEIPLFFYVNGNDFLFGEAAKQRFYSNDPNAFGNYFEIVKDPGMHFTISGNKKPVKQLFYYGVEKYLSHFINTVLYKSDSIENYRNLFPLRFLFETDIEAKEKVLVETLFSDAGYMNVQRIDYNGYLFDLLKQKKLITGKDSVIKLTGIDNNLYIELYKDLAAGLIVQTKIEGQGSDPRVAVLSEMIFEYISLQNPFLMLNMEVEIAAILPSAVTLLQNNAPIIKGEVQLSDGKQYYFRVSERSLNERLLFLSGDSVIYNAIDDLVRAYGLDIQCTTILLAGEEINAAYFQNTLIKKYPNVAGVGQSDELDVMKMIFSAIADAGYMTQPVVPATPPVMPEKKNIEKSVEFIKPVLPPVKITAPGKPTAKLPPALPPKKKPDINGPPSLPGINRDVKKTGLPPLPPKKN